MHTTLCRHAIVLGDFNADGRDDAVVAAPGHHFLSTATLQELSLGTAKVAYPREAPGVDFSQRIWRQEAPNVNPQMTPFAPGNAEDGGRFGWASLFFRLVTYRYGRGSILIPTNKSVRDWSELLAADEALTAAILGESRYYRAIGSAEALMLKAADLAQRWMKGVSRELALQKLREQPLPW